jgi:hypothetical protein
MDYITRKLTKQVSQFFEVYKIFYAFSKISDLQTTQKSVLTKRSNQPALPQAANIDGVLGGGGPIQVKAARWP